MELMVCGELLMVIAPSYMLGSIRDSMDLEFYKIYCGGTDSMLGSIRDSMYLEFYKIYCGGTDSMHSLQVPEP